MMRSAFVDEKAECQAANVVLLMNDGDTLLSMI